MPTQKQLPIVLGIIEHEGRFLMLRRIDDQPIWHHKWELPGGKLEFGEKPLETLVREITEETGLTITNPTLLGIHTYVWHVPNLDLQVILMVYRAQTDQSDVKMDPSENDAYKWVTLEEYKQLGETLEPNQYVIEQLYATIVGQG